MLEFGAVCPQTQAYIFLSNINKYFKHCYISENPHFCIIWFLQQNQHKYLSCALDYRLCHFVFAAAASIEQQAFILFDI